MSVTSTSQVSGSGTATITVQPNNSFEYDSSYYVQIDATAFDDPAGNSYAGIGDTTSWNFSTLILSGTITCNPVSISTTEGSSSSTAANCSGGTGLSYSVTQPSLGVSSESGGTITFDPNSEFEYLGESESEIVQGDFTYTANDGSEVSPSATVEVTVNGVNDPPTANDDEVSTDEDTAFTTTDLVADNDVDPDTSDTLTVVSIDTSGTTGDVTNNGDGTFTYDPNGQYESLAVGDSITDSFGYTVQDGSGEQDSALVTVTILGANDAPNAADDTTAGTDEDTAFRTANLVSANDTDPDSGDSLTVVSIDTTGTVGTVVNNGNGTFDYYPDGNFEYLGTGDSYDDSFEYTVSDGHGGQDTANAYVMVSGVNDAPSISSCTMTPNPAYSDGDLTANSSGWDDPEGDPANVLYEWYRNGSHLSAYSGSGTLPSGELSKGDDIELNCSPVDGEGLAGTGLTDNITISNSPPAAQDDAESTPEDTSITIDVLDNDSDADSGDTLTIISVTQGSDGSVTNNNTDVTYTPDSNFFGTDSFEYTVEDDDGETDSAVVTVTVSEETNMEASGNGQSITNGDTTPSTTDHTDFGNTSLFPGTVTRTFTITNQGSIDLRMTGSPRVEITGSHAGDFTVTDQPSTPLTSGSSTTFDIAFDPSAAGLREAVINIETDDLTSAFTFHIQGTATENDSDSDGMMDNQEQDGDRDGDGVADYQDYDPSGYFYDERNGKIVSGGSVAVTGPGVITIVEDGSSGYYQFLTDGTAGIYTMTVNLPPRYAWSTACLQSDPPAFDPTGQAEPVSLGNGEDGSTGFLTSNACTTFYLTFDLEADDPMIINNNFPLRKLPLPDTGFAPDRVTELPQQPDIRSYLQIGGMVLEIPMIDVETSLVGVPAVNGEWDVSWLGNQAGYLEGSAFPTWVGNTVITGHVWNANNQPGVFVDLKKLSYGDEIRIHAWGNVYIYQVQSSQLLSPYVTDPVMEHKEKDWLTLFTCEDFAEFWGEYAYRRVVQAVLVEVRQGD